MTVALDEAALAEALKSGQVGAAGLDVYAKEPSTDSPLFGLPNTVVTPHLGASTTEAQDKAGTAVAQSVRLALQGEFVPDAVNVQAGGVVAEDVRPGLPLAEKLGRVFTAVAGGLAQSVTVDVRGKLAEFDDSVLQLAVLKGVFSDVVEEQVTYVNAPLFAEQRGRVFGHHVNALARRFVVKRTRPARFEEHDRTLPLEELGYFPPDPGPLPEPGDQQNRFAQRRSTIIAMPWPPPTHIVSRPIVSSRDSRSFRSVHMIRAPVIP